jgi:hypothetical protein
MKKRPRTYRAFFDFSGNLFLRYLPIEIGILNLTFYPCTPILLLFHFTMAQKLLYFAE